MIIRYRVCRRPFARVAGRRNWPVNVCRSVLRARPLAIALATLAVLSLSPAKGLAGTGIAPTHASRPSWPVVREVARPGNALGKESFSDVWRGVRAGRAFKLSDPGLGTGVLVRSGGQDWRNRHLLLVRRYGGVLILLALGAVASFFVFRGRVRIEGGRSGRTIARFNQAERLIHWFVAGVFILLALSGLILLFGRVVIADWLGKAGFGVVVSAMMQTHNLFGPIFIVGILAMAVVYLKDNLPEASDLTWLVRGGPFFIGHLPAGKNNAGEKAWFWIAVLGGGVLSVSGLALEFPWIVAELRQWQLANLAHGIAAVAVIAVAIGHIYLGTVGVEGALDGMVTGRADEAWARQHHDLWLGEMSADAGPDAERPERPLAQPRTADTPAE